MTFSVKDSSIGSRPGESRRARRSRSNVAVEIHFQGRSVPGRIFDLSESGMQVVAERILMPPKGSTIVIKAREIGTIEGIVRWCRDGRIGMQFDGHTASVAQMKAYFRFFHQNQGR